MQNSSYYERNETSYELIKSENKEFCILCIKCPFFVSCKFSLCKTNVGACITELTSGHIKLTHPSYDVLFAQFSRNLCLSLLYISVLLLSLSFNFFIYL